MNKPLEGSIITMVYLMLLNNCCFVRTGSALDIVVDARVTTILVDHGHTPFGHGPVP